MDIINRILQLTKDRNVTGVEVGKLLGLAKSPLTDWKNGKSNPTIEQIIALCESFAISTDYILMGKTGTMNTDYTEDITSRLPKAEQELLHNYRKLDSRGQYKLQTIVYEELDRAKSDRFIQENISKGKEVIFDLPPMESSRQPLKK